MKKVKIVLLIEYDENIRDIKSVESSNIDGKVNGQDIVYYVKDLIVNSNAVKLLKAYIKRR